MAKHIKSEKGMSMIEVIIASALIAIVIYPISLFFLTNYKTFNKADSQINVQQNLQITASLFTDKVIEVKQIVSLKDDSGGDLSIDSLEQTNISRVVFYNVLDNDYYILEIKDTDGDNINELCFAESADENAVANMIYAKFIKQIAIEPINGSFRSCNGIKFRIAGVSEKGDFELEISNEIYFRNKDTL